MEVINIKSTDDTPKVILDAENNIMEITGRSLPEDVGNFYKHIIEWVNEYSKKPNPSTVFKFKLDYFNTASSKNILSILMTLKELHKSGNNVIIEWFYNEDDEEMLESGVEFERIVKIPFKHEKYSD
jgi:hypothetical protein